MTHASPSALKILLIEDDATVRDVLSRMLTSLGHTVLQAAEGREGLERLEAGEAVDLLLTDLRMPNVTGWGVVKTVKARWPNLKVGVVTGTPETLWEEHDPAVDLVIAKPMRLPELQEALSRVLPGRAPPATATPGG
ncbi:MAG: response regulator [Candidatus Methylomirabilia bacterium]